VKESEYLHSEQIIYDGTLAADAAMRTVTYYGELCRKQKLLEQSMWEEKGFGSITEAERLREEVARIEDMRSELLKAFYDSFDDLFARYSALCKQQ
jgi:acyl carrier protein phosphodiesterase